jgi:hypothetical protein
MDICQAVKLHRMLADTRTVSTSRTSRTEAASIRGSNPRGIRARFFLKQRFVGPTQLWKTAVMSAGLHLPTHIKTATCSALYCGACAWVGFPLAF